MKYDIVQVARQMGMHFLKDTTKPNVPVVCPFCGNAKGKMTIRKEKNGNPINVYHCWKCGSSGNMYQLYAKVMGFSFDTAESLRKSLDDFMNVGLRIEQSEHVIIEKEFEESRKASIKTLDNTYRTMLSMLPLRKCDKEDLQRRGLSEEQIKAGMFASTPKDVFGICRKLLDAGCTLDGVPGFYLHKTGRWALNVWASGNGYFCPCVQDGFVVGCQIRLAKPKNDMKYIWLSSADKDHGCSSGSPAIFCGNPKSTGVIITEGILKAYVSYCFLSEKKADISVMGVPGVAAVKDVSRLLKKHSHKCIYEAYDMDKNMDGLCRCDYGRFQCGECVRKKHMNLELSTGLCRKKLEKRKMLKNSLDRLEKEIKKAGNFQVHHYIWNAYENGLWKGEIKGLDDELLERNRKNEIKGKTDIV